MYSLKLFLGKAMAFSFNNPHTISILNNTSDREHKLILYLPILSTHEHQKLTMWDENKTTLTGNWTAWPYSSNLGQKSLVIWQFCLKQCLNTGLDGPAFGSWSEFWTFNNLVAFHHFKKLLCKSNLFQQCSPVYSINQSINPYNPIQSNSPYNHCQTIYIYPIHNSG